MQQRGFFSQSDREELLDKLRPPADDGAGRRLAGFPSDAEADSLQAALIERGRKRFDVILMFKPPVLQQLFNRRGDQTGYPIWDRHSLCRFLGLTPEGAVPSAKTIWSFREQWT